MWSWQGYGVNQPDPVEVISIKWDGTKWVQNNEKELG
jgi:hypothetical protein